MEHFTFKEFFHSDLSDTLGIDNRPSAAAEEIVRMNILTLVDHVLDPVREMAKRPVRITSGYRCAELNRMVGGKPNSQHLNGQAADFTIDGFTAKDYKRLAYWCVQYTDFDQLIIFPKRKFAHVSYVSMRLNRRQVFLNPLT